MQTVTEALREFLASRKGESDLAAKVAEHLPGLEVQINVSMDGGEAVEGRRNTYTDGREEWFNIRIPKHASTEPTWREYPLSWTLAKHVEGIGSTGWDWQNRCSRWVGFDFDSITSHAAGTGVTDDDLRNIRQATEALPYVETRRSTGGSGLHCYVYLDEIPTANHTEHAALARAVLSLMSTATGFDFAAQVDVCGGNMWVWHRKITAAVGGLQLLQRAKQALKAEDLPANWRDHLDVVSHRRAKVRLPGLDAKHQAEFAELTGKHHSRLDEQHKAVIAALGRTGYSTIWVADHGLLQTHTRALQMILEDPATRAELRLCGIYRTISTGSDPRTCNCFAFPLADGGWHVYRFSRGAPETSTWTQDGRGWTSCYFNVSPTLRTAAIDRGGLENVKKDSYSFSTFAAVAQTVHDLGYHLSPPAGYEQSPAVLCAEKSGKLTVAVARRPDLPTPNDWCLEKSKLIKVIGAAPKARPTETDDQSSRIRATTSTSGQFIGFLKLDENKWTSHPRKNIENILVSDGAEKRNLDAIMGTICNKDWRIVNLPFQPEYPGNRQWNREAAQYRFQPAAEPGEHPHWDKVLEHCFADLDQAIRECEWAKKANVKRGCDYGLLWIACLLRNPLKPLPYLFFYGEQDSGKSSLHEAITLLMTKGVASARRALKDNQSDFNGELAGAILAVIEEVDITKEKGAYSKIKDWTTSPTLWIRKMRTDAYPMPNSLHFIQTANSPEFCPVFPGDTRIIVMHVPKPKVDIPKDVLMARLEEEAPAFMRTLLDTPLPAPVNRFQIPVIETQNKTALQDLNRGLLEEFVKEHCFPVVGERLRFSEFWERFQAWLPPEERGEWSRKRISFGLRGVAPIGVHTDNVLWIGNLSWEDRPSPDAKPWSVWKGRLRQ